MRFVHFSAGYIIAHPGEPGIISDFRYSAVPNTIAPLWGIDLGEAKPGKHLDFQRFNQVGEVQRAQFIDQLMGR